MNQEGSVFIKKELIPRTKLGAKEFTLSNAKGYTIVELLVVMGIIAILLPLTFGGYNGVRKQKYVQHVANLTQTNIRDTFIDILSTKVESTGATCNGKSPQIKAVRIKLDSYSGATTNPVSKIALCEDNHGELKPPDVVEPDIDPSSGLNYKQSIKVKCQGCAWSGMGYVYLAFTSPYGKFYSYYTGETNSVDADKRFYTFSNNPTPSAWTKNINTFIYEPTGSVVAGTLNPNISYISFEQSAGTGILHKITISKNGNVKLD